MTTTRTLEEVPQTEELQASELAGILTNTSAPESVELTTPAATFERTQQLAESLTTMYIRLNDRFFSRENSEDAILAAEFNLVADHKEKGTLSEIGLDLSRANLRDIISAIVRGSPPVEIDAARVNVDSIQAKEGRDTPLSPEETCGIYIGAVFGKLIGDMPQARIVATVEDDNPDFTEAQAKDDQHIVQTAEILGNSGAISVDDDVGEDFVIVGHEQQVDQLESLADKLLASAHGKLSEAEDGRLVFFPDASLVDAVGLSDTPDGQALIENGIVLSRNGVVESVGMRTGSILASTREDALHLSIITPKDASEYMRSLVLLGAIGKNVQNFQSIEIDPAKIDPVLATIEVTREISTELRQVADDALFDVIVEQGLETPYASSETQAAVNVTRRLERLDARHVKALLPKLVEFMDVTPSEFNDAMIGVLCDKLAEKLGDSLVDDPDYDELWKNPKFLTIIGVGHVSHISQFKEKAGPDGKPEAPSQIRKNLWRKFFDIFGLDDKERADVKAAWNSRKEDLFTHAPKEIRAMTAIFTRRPDALSKIYKNFGIRNFARYRPEMLLQQLEDLESGKITDYLTLVISARDDWNGAMDNFAKNIS